VKGGLSLGTRALSQAVSAFLGAAP